jgi:hypothetical protein
LISSHTINARISSHYASYIAVQLLGHPAQRGIK